MMKRSIASLVVMLTVATSARAQQIIAPTEQLAFDRPEAWALQYFTSASLMTGLDTAMPERPGSVTAQLEVGWIPPVTPAEEKVGFGGTADEDLNKAPIFVRPRIRVGVPGRLALTVAATPPVHVFGVTARLGAIGVDWTVHETDQWRLALRAHGETGTVTGAFTCPARVLVSPPGSPGNPKGCEAPSSDAVTLRYGTLEMDVARALIGFRGLTPHLAIGMNGIDSHFQVDARTFGFLDHTRLYTSGITWSVSAGASLAIGKRVAVAGDAFYTPLLVRRVTNGPRTNDALFTVRGLISYRIR